MAEDCAKMIMGVNLEEKRDVSILIRNRPMQALHFHAIMLVATAERPDGEEVRYEMSDMLMKMGCHSTILLLDSSELMNADIQQAVQAAISKGALILPIFTETFVKDKECLNLLYSFIMGYMKRTGENANFFIPVFFDNPRKSKFIPILFCNFRGIWWERERDREMMVKIFVHYFGNGTGGRITNQ